MSDHIADLGPYGDTRRAYWHNLDHPAAWLNVAAQRIGIEPFIKGRVLLAFVFNAPPLSVRRAAGPEFRRGSARHLAGMRSIVNSVANLMNGVRRRGQIYGKWSKAFHANSFGQRHLDQALNGDLAAKQEIPNL
jgi:hypothetical protein